MRIIKNSSIVSIATTLKYVHEGCRVGIFIPPKVGNFTPPLTVVVGMPMLAFAWI